MANGKIKVFCITCRSACGAGSISCNTCGKWTHGKCINLSKKQITYYANQLADPNGERWTCSSCVTEEDEEDQVEIENEQFQGSRYTIDDIMHKLLEMEANHNILVKKIEQQDVTIKTLISRIEQIESTNKNSKDIPVMTNTIIKEIDERKKRENNIVVYGIEESTRENSEDRKTDDQSNIARVLTSVTNNVVVDDIKFFRLGKRTNGKHRPIKVILNSSKDVHNVFKNKNKLGNAHPGVKIGADQTLIQRQEFKKVNDELVRRKAEGEADLFIKYEIGYPIIKKEVLINL